jgi:hypothetical protein
MFEFSKPQPIVFPEDAQTLLLSIRAVLIELADQRIRSVAGGGILRDLYLDRPFKDIDLFVNAADASDEKILSVLISMGFDARVVVSNEAIEYLSFTDVASVIEANHPVFSVPVQVIRVAQNNLSGERMIERLDLGPCQIGMDYHGSFWFTDQFWDDVSHRNFTVTRDEGNDRERSIKRFDRLSVKYIGWKLVLP